MTFPKGGSEYGGYPGVIQPAPHDIADVPSEVAMLTVQTDPSDPSATSETVAEAHRKQGRLRNGG